jgi:hypothetical protein
MARTIHLCVVVSGLAMMAEGFVALFYKPAWMVQQNAITVRGILVAVAFGVVVALLDVAFVRLRTVRIAQATSRRRSCADRLAGKKRGRTRDEVPASSVAATEQ